MSRLRVLDLPADRMEGEAVAVLFFSDDRPAHGPAALLDWRLNGFLTGLLLRGEAGGRAGEHVLTRNNGKLAADWVLFVGGGSQHDLDRLRYQELIRDLLATCRRAGFSRIAISLAPLEGMGSEELEKLVARILTEEGADGFECLLSPAVRERGPEVVAGELIEHQSCRRLTIFNRVDGEGWI